MSIPRELWNKGLLQLVDCLNKADVRYVFVGGYAVNMHGYHRNTGDIDILIDTSPSNADKMVLALRASGVSDPALAPEIFMDTSFNVQVGDYPNKIEFIKGISGVAFEMAFERKVTMDVMGTPVHIISLKDLLESKIRARRPKDLLDYKMLKDSLPPEEAQ